jgi:hypothetical protein
MRRRLLLAFACLVAPAHACLDTEFLAGVRCTRDDDCGRSMSCDGGVCGGCSDDARGPDGRCDCPGNRVLECGSVPVENACVPVCASAIELCAVAMRRDDGDHDPLEACSDAAAGEPCFRVELDAGACEAGEAEVIVESAPPSTAVLLVNCPPPSSEDGRFDCL